MVIIVATRMNSFLTVRMAHTLTADIRSLARRCLRSSGNGNRAYQPAPASYL
jgi:hypothetical protein